MVSNLPDIQKTDWVNSDIVMPADTNAWGTAINTLSNDIPLYAHIGNFYTATYSDNIYTLTPLTGNVTLSAYTNGMSVSFFCPAANSAGCKVKIGSLSAVNIKDMNNTALVASALRQGELVSLIYDSSNSCFKVSTLYASVSLDNLNSAGLNKILPAQSSSVNGYFLKTDGTTASWFDLLSSNNTFTGNNTFSGNVTISGGIFNFPKCTTKPTTTSTASDSNIATIVTNYRSGRSWYRIWSDKFIMQGGVVNQSSDTVSVSLLRTMADTNYLVFLTGESTTVGSVGYYAPTVGKISDKTTSSFKSYHGNGSSSMKTQWMVCGWLE